MKRIFAALALVALGGLTACNPTEALDYIEHTLSGEATSNHRPVVVDDPSTPADESNPSAPPFDPECCNPDAVTILAPEDVPEPVQSGWTWDLATKTVTNYDVPALQVRAKHGPFQEPLLVPFVTLTPGQSVTIPAAPCGSKVTLVIGSETFHPFTFC